MSEALGPNEWGGQSEWAPGEVVRSVQRLIESHDRFEQETRAGIRALEADFKEHYVSKETLQALMEPMLEHRDRASQWVHELVGPLLSGALVGIIMYLVQHH